MGLGARDGLSGESTSEACVAEGVGVVACLEGDVGVVKGAEADVSRDADSIVAAPSGGLVDGLASTLDVLEGFLGFVEFFAESGAGGAELLVNLAELLVDIWPVTVGVFLKGEVLTQAFELLVIGHDLIMALGDGGAVWDLIFFRAADEGEGALERVFDDVDEFEALAMAEVILV